MSLHRPRKVFESRGQTGVKTKPVLGLGTGGGRLLPQRGLWGLTPEKFWKFNVQNGTFWGKLQYRFDYKQTAILTQTFGHKWFSEGE